MNILFSVNNLGTGGVTTYVSHLAKALSVRNQVVIFVHYPYNLDPEWPFAEDDKVVVESTQVNRIKDWFDWKINGFLTRTCLSDTYREDKKNKYFLKVLRRYDIDVVLSFDRYSDQVATSLKYLHGLPVVLSLHGNYDNDSNNPWSNEDKIEFKIIFTLADGIIYKTDSNIKIINELGPFYNLKFIQLVPHAYSMKKPSLSREKACSLYGLDNADFVFIMIARADETKGWTEALDAFTLLKKEVSISGKTLRFLAKGDGEYMKTLKDMYKEHSEIVFLSPACPNRQCLVMADAGVLPTYFSTENYSYAIIEYLAFGLPVIASEHGKIAETLATADGPAGILLPLAVNGKCDVVEIKNAMLRLIQDKALYDQLKSVTSNAISKFSGDQAALLYEQNLQKLV